MISVCMATYNGAKYLREQIDSILAQLSEADELIVSDDSSTDNTLEVLKVYNDSRIKVFKNTNRKGVVGNFENALMQVKGDYIFLSDQDDVWLDGKVEKCIEALKNSDLVLHDNVIMNSTMETIITNSFFEYRKTKTGYINNLVRNSYIGCCMAFKASLLSKILPFPPQIAMHDIWIGLRTERYGKIALINRPLIQYRRHETNASSTGGKSTLSIFDQLFYRLRMLIYTLK